MDGMKKLMKGEIRYIARKWEGNVWGVYDRAMGSWPKQRPDLGTVQQQVAKGVAEQEAKRLNVLAGINPDGTVPTAPTTSKAVKAVKATKPATKSTKAAASTEVKFEAVEIPVEIPDEPTEPAEVEAYNIEEFGATDADELAAKYEGAYL